jgi:phosphoribosyl 1,2-cyclic phosphodiesterase
MAASISIKFLGVRAIHANPSRHNQTTGGSTGCIQIDDGTTKVFINAGFGLNAAGSEIIADAKQASRHPEVNILFSDFLWESTLGLPSFLPMHFKSSTINILTAGQRNNAIDALNDAASKFFTPFDGLDSLPAKKNVIEAHSPVALGAWTLQGMIIPNELTPEGSAIWRFRHQDGHSIGIVMLCEPTHESLAKVTDFLSGCDTLICSASNTDPPYQSPQSRLGFDEALTLATAANVHSLILTQFHPSMTDANLQQQLISMQRKIDNLKARGVVTTLSVRLAHELEPILALAASQQKIAV